MSQSIQSIHLPRTNGTPTANPFDLSTAQTVRTFHSSFPEYAPTPLVRLHALADRLGVAELYVKDESKRFGLNAFKVLGGSYAIGREIARRLDIPLKELSYPRLTAPDVRTQLQTFTFVTATDGNHGRGIAWTAARLGANSVVYMPKGSAQERLNNIRALGAHAEITCWNYDDTVRYACQQAKEQGWILVQDTTWPGYEEIPTWIMEGYTTMALEAAEQLEDTHPTHIFLQSGVGAMAGAAAGFFCNYYSAQPPRIGIVEPHNANCMFRTAQAGDGQLHSVGGDLSTIMAGLACGEPCQVAWEILNVCAQDYLSVPDSVAAKGMRVLGNPLGSDPKIISGESGAVTTGLLVELMSKPALTPLREQLHLDCNSRILCISTEGDTDQEHYRTVVWDGKYASG